MAVALATLTVAACGGGGGGSAATTAATSPGTVPAEVSSTVGTFASEPKIDLEPLASRPQAGARVIYLANSAVPTDVQNVKGVESAAQVLGWQTSSMAYDGTPAGFANAMGQATSEKPDAIAFAGQEPDVAPDAVKAAKEAGIKVVAFAIATAPTGLTGDGTSGVALGIEATKQQGRIAADWAIEDSGGNAHVAVVSTPAFPSQSAKANAYVDEMKAQCGGCSTTLVNVNPQDIGKKVPAAVVSTLQSDPKLNYIFFSFGNLSLGVYPALSAAGLTEKVKPTTAVATPETFQDLRDGRMAMVLNLSVEVDGYLILDAVARSLATDAAVVTNPSPFQLFTKDTVPANGTPLSPSDYVDQFRTIWRITP
ncbi:sugar ABC transporter substrate-binding protein [Pseudonocardia xishanensis]|uniref:sugar ABC transporter substrate-binding protein n=1 Tax=Pseudonocardia xishanensis TaxID=630995 RepID=UPI0031EDFAE1